MDICLYLYTCVSGGMGMLQDGAEFAMLCSAGEGAGRGLLNYGLLSYGVRSVSEIIEIIKSMDPSDLSIRGSDQMRSNKTFLVSHLF